MDELGITASRTLWARGGKRVVDIAVALPLCIVLLPLWIVTAIAVKLTSPGSILFSQIRSGRCGREFRIYKFRTMRGGRKPDPKELVPLDHPEITTLGRFLRRTKIDELPQLYSVLVGDMTIIGPRPTLPDQVAAYDDFQKQRLLVRPGCTGLAQVNGNTNLDWDERIKYDVYYVGHCRFLLDLLILVRTVVVVLRGDGAFTRLFEDSPYAKRGTREVDAG